MALIKHAQSGDLASDAVVLDLGDLRREGERLRARAQAEADRIIAEARAERERLITGAREEGFELGKQEGHAEGVEEGRADGREEARAEAAPRLDALAQSLEQAVERVDAAHEQAMREARRDVLDLALAIGERVAKRAVELDEDAALKQVEAALEVLLRATDLAIQVHPDDAASVEEALPSLKTRLDRSARMRVEPDPSLTRGSAIVRTSGGEIDATVEGQIARIVDSLRPLEDQQSRSRKRSDEQANDAPQLPNPSDAADGANPPDADPDPDPDPDPDA